MVAHDFECRAHGVFQARVKPGSIPRCPRGCSPHFVQLVFLSPPAISTERVRMATRLVKEVAESQGLSDIDVSPSRPGDSVADRNYKRNKPSMQARAAEFSKYMSALTHRSNELSNLGFGHPYDAREWQERKATGKLAHVGALPPIVDLPANQYGAQGLRVKE